ncbi:MAG: hypothetical protein LC749_07080, partial [Actinobacteria bacterium]|nr:hypothetical protein [Actinomycetota bacterium]
MITMILLGLVFLAVVVPQTLSARSERRRAFVDSIHFHAGALAERNRPGTDPAPALRPRSAVGRR